MRHEEFEPAAELEPLVACYGSFMVDRDEAPPAPHVIVPDGTVSIVYIRGDAPRSALF